MLARCGETDSTRPVPLDSSARSARSTRAGEADERECDS
jgi:hypothetical protein